jgi:3-phenylpropionate/trans-cinnamate dioxygenase ferredoxin reductase subunit
MSAQTLDLTQGIPFASLRDGESVLGHVGKKEVMVVRRGDEVFAVGALCTHYHGNLADGLVVGDTVRCPWHHACFSLRTGKVLRAPALDPIACWRVERTGDKVFVREKLNVPAQPVLLSRGTPESVVIVGGGAAGLAAAVTLRREGFQKPITIVSADDTAPYDRPNLSKDYLAGTAQEAWMPLRAQAFYADNHIDLMLNTRATGLDVTRKQLTLADGRQISFDALLLATGAEPVQASIPGAPSGSVCYLRTFADCRAILQKAGQARRVVILGASFIALETAASLRAREIEVHVVGRGQLPLERVLGPQLAQFVKQTHESHGVVFHMGATIAGMEGRTVNLSDGTKLEADFVIAGVGVRPALELAKEAGLTSDHVVPVDERMQTRAPGIYAAGDIAQWPDPVSGSRIRVEHWVVAERQGEVAARNMLGAGEAFAAAPFFWSQHYDMAINYTGHAPSWDDIEVSGDIASRDCAVRYRRQGRTLAIATISRDRLNLEVEVALETGK